MSNNNNNNPDNNFHILPHPAKSNDPPQLGAGLTNKPEISAHHARDPHVPSAEILSKLDAPLSREELKKRAEQLNK